MKYFQRAKSRWQSSPRKKLSPLPQTDLTPVKSSLLPPIVAKSVDKQLFQQESSGGTVTEAHVKAIVNKKLFQKETIPESKTPETAVSDDEEQQKPFREGLVAFYEEYNPSKLDTVDATLEKFRGNEEELFDKLNKKYVETSGGIPPPNGKGPTCFLEFEFGQQKGRVEVKLFADKTPLAAENFRALCTGEKGTGRSAKPLCFKDCSMHRIVEQFVIQGGDFTKGDGTGGESIYAPNSEHGDMWGKFKDEGFMQHNRKGLLSMANNGANRNGSQFFITLAALPNLNGKHVVFGEVTSGMEFVEQISKLPTDKKQRPLETVVIRDCGEVRDGKDIRASEQAVKTGSGSSQSTTGPFGFTACKPSSFGSVSSKQSPFSVPASSTTPAPFGGSSSSTENKESPFSFSAASTKPFLFGGSTATKPFSFASAAASSQPASTKPFSFATTARPEVSSDAADDDSSASSSSSGSTTASEESEDEATPLRSLGFGQTTGESRVGTETEDTSTAPSFSLSGDTAAAESPAPPKPISFGAPQIKSLPVADKATAPSFSFSNNKASSDTTPIPEQPATSGFSALSVSSTKSDESSCTHHSEEEGGESADEDDQPEIGSNANENDEEDSTSSVNVVEEHAKVEESNPPPTSTSRRIVTTSSRTKETKTSESKPSTNPFAGINFADKTKSDPDQLKKLAQDASKESPSSSGVSSAESISEVESGSSSDAASPRDTSVGEAVSPTKAAETTAGQQSPFKSSFAFSQTSPLGKPQQKDEDKPSFSFGGIGNAVGQPSMTSQLPTTDNPFTTFAVGKTPMASSSSSSFSFGKSAPALPSSQADQQQPTTTSFSLGSSAPPASAQTATSNKDATSSFSFGSTAPSTSNTFAFAQNQAPKSPKSTSSRFSGGWFGSPKDKKD